MAERWIGVAWNSAILGASIAMGNPVGIALGGMFLTNSAMPMVSDAFSRFEGTWISADGRYEYSRVPLPGFQKSKYPDANGEYLYYRKLYYEGTVYDVANLYANGYSGYVGGQYWNSLPPGYAESRGVPIDAVDSGAVALAASVGQSVFDPVGVLPSYKVKLFGVAAGIRMNATGYAKPRLVSYPGTKSVVPVEERFLKIVNGQSIVGSRSAKVSKSNSTTRLGK